MVAFAHTNNVKEKEVDDMAAEVFAILEELARLYYDNIKAFNTVLSERTVFNTGYACYNKYVELIKRHCTYFLVLEDNACYENQNEVFDENDTLLTRYHILVDEPIKQIKALFTLNTQLLNEAFPNMNE